MASGRRFTRAACFEWSGGLHTAPISNDGTVVRTLTDLMTQAISWRET